MKKVILPLICLLLLSGCGRKSNVTLDPTELGSDRKMYENAMKYISRDPEKARLLFKEVMHLFPDSVYATRSKLGVADSYFKEKDSASLTMAAAEYQEYVNLYPYSPDAVYAKNQIAMCYFKQVRRPGRDQSNSFLAIKAYEALIQQYPDAPEAQEAKKKITEIRMILAKHFYNIGYYNYKLQAYRGAIARFKQVMDEYPEYKTNPNLYMLTGRCYERIGEPDTAISFYQRIISDFTNTSHARKALKAIQAIDKAKKNATTPPGAGPAGAQN